MSVFNKKPSEEPTIKAESFQHLSDKVFENVASYVEPAIIPQGGIVGIYGDSKVGKSFICLNMARALATGETLFNIKDFKIPKPVKVLYAEAEVGELSLQDRGLRILDGVKREHKENNLLYVSKNPKLKLDTDEGIDLFAKVIEDVKPNVLIIDPIGKFHSQEESNSTAMGKIFNVFAEFQKINDDTNMAIVFSHHIRKPPNVEYSEGYDPLDVHNARGSSRFFSDPDTIIMVNRFFSSKKPWPWWKIRTRYYLRHGGEPNEYELEVNKKQYKDWNDGDLRVKYPRTEPLKKPFKGTPKDPEEQVPLF